MRAALLLTALASALLLGGCPGGRPSTDNPTGAFLGEPSDWEKCRVTLHDSFGLTGYHELVIDGSRRGAERKVERFWKETRHKLEVDPGDVTALLRKCAELDVLSLADAPGPPDGGHSRITLRNAKGEQKSVTIYDAAEVPEAFTAATGAVRSVAAASLRTLEYEGDYQEEHEFPSF